MENVREYRRGISYRSGDISEKEFKREFRFSNIGYGSSLDEKDKRKYLNYVYDSLKDLSEVFKVSSSFLSLQNKMGAKPSILIASKPQNLDNMFVSLSGNLLYYWAIFLDRFMGYSENLENGLIDNLSLNLKTFYAKKVKTLLYVLKYKQAIVEKNYDTEKESILNLIKEEMDKISVFVSDVEISSQLSIAESLYLRNLTMDTLDNLINKYASYLDISVYSESFEKLKNLQDNLDRLLEKENINDFEIVETEFYKSCKKIDKDSRSVELNLFAFAINFYVESLLKQKGNYNNFLFLDENNLGLSLLSDEKFAIFDGVSKFLNDVIPYINEQIIYDDESEDIEVAEEKRIEVIDDEVANDKGKFKLTLLIKLLQENNFNLDLSKVDKSIGGCYYIYFKDKYINNIRPSVYNHPKDKRHKIDIYCGKDGKRLLQYWWDYELDYQDFVNYLLKIERDNESLYEQEEKEQELRYKKFRLTEFKDLCLNNGLKVSQKESQILVDKFYKIDFNANTDNIKYIMTPIKIDTDSSVKQRFEVTLRNNEKVYFYWNGVLDYEKAVAFLLKCKKEGIKENKEEKNISSKNVNIAEIEKEVKKENINNSDILTTKDLRDLLVKNIDISKTSMLQVNNIQNVINILMKNVSYIDGVELRIFINSIQEKNLQGNSKSWCLVDSSTLVISNRAEFRKQLEGVIEGFVNYNMLKYQSSNVKKEMVIEGLTFMLCKTFKLDVRTYCMNSSFEKLIKSGQGNIIKYVKSLVVGYNKLLVYFCE